VKPETLYKDFKEQYTIANYTFGHFFWDITEDIHSLDVEHQTAKLKEYLKTKYGVVFSEFIIQKSREYITRRIISFCRRKNRARIDLENCMNSIRDIEIR